MIVITGVGDGAFRHRKAVCSRRSRSPLKGFDTPDCPRNRMRKQRAICLQGKRDIRCACDIIAVWRLRYVAILRICNEGRESPLPPAVSSSREHAWRLCRSFATLKDDSKGGVASYATEGSRRADDICAYDVYVIMVGDGPWTSRELRLRNDANRRGRRLRRPANYDWETMQAVGTGFPAPLCGV